MRSSNRNAFAAGSFSVLLSACSPAPETARHTVPEYQADAQLRNQKVAECVKDPGTLGMTPDCINAKQAQVLQDTGSLRDSPSLGLSSGSATDRPESGSAEPGRAPPN